MVSSTDSPPRDIEKLDHASILRKRAEDYRRARRVEDAMMLMSRAAAIEKGRSPKNYWRDTGQCLCEIGRYEEAVECFDKDLQINGDNHETYYAKGVALYVLEIYREALECIYKAYEIKDAQELKTNIQIESLKTHKKFEDVLKQFGKQGTSKSGDYLLWYYLGLILFQLARYKDATDSFQKAARMSSEPLILYEWAKCELMLNQLDRCCELLETARNHDDSITKMLRIDPTFDSLRNKERFRVLLDHRTTYL